MASRFDKQNLKARPKTLNTNIFCWFNDETCAGCPHSFGLAKECSHKPKGGIWMVINYLGRWLMQISLK